MAGWVVRCPTTCPVSPGSARLAQQRGGRADGREGPSGGDAAGAGPTTLNPAPGQCWQCRGEGLRQGGGRAGLPPALGPTRAWGLLLLGCRWVQRVGRVSAWCWVPRQQRDDPPPSLSAPCWLKGTGWGGGGSAQPPPASAGCPAPLPLPLRLLRHHPGLLRLTAPRRGQGGAGMGVGG